MSCWALIALKSSAAAKGRLAETLPAEIRQRLVEQMFADVLGALRAAQQVEGIAVVTNETLTDPDLLRFDDPGQGLNAALAYGAAELAGRGVDELLILHADLPLASGAEIDALISAGRTHGLAIASDKAGQGSNALYLALPHTRNFRFQFGPDSLRLHQLEAARQGGALTTIAAPGLNFDIDEAQDIEQLLLMAPERYEFLSLALQHKTRAMNH
jgi:2-phospho-L-lactate guanylyltransferase